MRIGLYPGTFDPVTNGHVDIIQRSFSLCDRLIVGVAGSIGKQPLFSLEERVEIVREEIQPLQAKGLAIEVQPFDHLLMHYAAELGAAVIIRGLRAASDFEYEFQMAGMNARLNPDIQTVFLMASDRCQFISSRFVREIGRLDGDITKFVSANVAARLQQKFALEKPSIPGSIA
jgi:pantetheine-phosphate adenylyltransferase